MNVLEREVWQVVSDMNRAWAVEGNSDVLKDYFHANMVAITSTDRERIEGKDACLAAWKVFVDKFEVQYFREKDPHVRIYGAGTCAVATYYFELSCSAGGQTFKSSGRDMFVLAKEDGKWWIVADQFSGYPAESA
jgi:hypothetical protein